MSKANDFPQLEVSTCPQFCATWTQSLLLRVSYAKRELHAWSQRHLYMLLVLVSRAHAQALDG